MDWSKYRFLSVINLEKGKVIVPFPNQARRNLNFELTELVFYFTEI